MLTVVSSAWFNHVPLEVTQKVSKLYRKSEVYIVKRNSEITVASGAPMLLTNISGTQLCSLMTRSDHPLVPGSRAAR